MQLGRRAYLRSYVRLHYEEITKPPRWGNKTFLLDGNDIRVQVKLTEQGAKLIVTKYICSWLKGLLFWLEEQEYQSLRSPDGWVNSIMVSIKTSLVKQVKNISLRIFHLWCLVSHRIGMCVQSNLIEEEGDWLTSLEEFDGLQVNQLVNMVLFLVYADEIFPCFVSQHWRFGYHITKEMVTQIQKILESDNWEENARYNEKNALKRIIINYCRLRIGKHSQLSDSNDRNEIDEYLNSLSIKEKARLIAKLVEDAVSHRRYRDLNVTLMDPIEDRRVQIAIDDRYLDLVSVYHKHSVNYYRVGEKGEILRLLQRSMNFQEQIEMADGGYVSRHKEFEIRGKTVTYTNFNYRIERENEIAEGDKKLIIRSGFLDLSFHELTTRCFYKNNGVYVSIGFGNCLSRHGHEDAIGLEKKIGKNVLVRPTEIHIRRLGLLPVIFYSFSAALVYVVLTNVSYKKLSLDNLDRIGIVFATWSIIAWVFSQFTVTSGGLKDLLQWRATFTKISQVRQHFNMSRATICRSFYSSKFLTSLIGSGYDCYFLPGKTNGPLEMDEIARFNEVIGRSSLAMKNELLVHGLSKLYRIDMKSNDNIAHLELNSKENPHVNEDIETLFNEGRNVMFDERTGGEVIRTDFFIG